MPWGTRWVGCHDEWGPPLPEPAGCDQDRHGDPLCCAVVTRVAGRMLPWLCGTETRVEVGSASLAGADPGHEQSRKQAVTAGGQQRQPAPQPAGTIKTQSAGRRVLATAPRSANNNQVPRLMHAPIQALEVRAVVSGRELGEASDAGGLGMGHRQPSSCRHLDQSVAWRSPIRDDRDSKIPVLVK